MSDCCKAGFEWDGKPTGKEAKIGRHDTYIAGDNKDIAIFLITDVFGWKLNNARLLADHYAKEIGATVFVPDVFDGEVTDPDLMASQMKQQKFDIQGFVGRHGKEIRGPEMTEIAQAIRKEGFKKIGAVGFCYGGWACLQLAKKGESLVDAISVAHPSFCTKDEFKAVGVPIQIVAPETDPQLTPELKTYCNETIPTLGVEYDYQYFPGVSHGFACRADKNDATQKRALERAKNVAVHWFVQQLAV